MDRKKVAAKYNSFYTWHNGGMIKKPMLSPIKKEVAQDKDDSGIDSSLKNKQKFQCEQCVYSTPYRFRLENHAKAVHGGKVEGPSEGGLLIADVRTEVNPEASDNDSGFVPLSASTSEDELNSPEDTQKAEEESPKDTEGEIEAPKEASFNCEDCDYKSDHRGHFNTHIRAVHNKGELLQCGDCEYQTGRKNSFDTHRWRVHGKGDCLKCELCGFADGHRGRFNAHMREVHGKGELFRCEDCEYQTHNRMKIKAHTIKDHGKDHLLKCEDCEFRSGRWDKLRSHMARVHEKGEFIDCEDCDYKTSNKSHLREHMASRHGKGNFFQCSHCEYKSGRRSRMTAHEQNVHKYKVEKMETDEDAQSEDTTEKDNEVNTSDTNYVLMPSDHGATSLETTVSQSIHLPAFATVPVNEVTRLLQTLQPMPANEIQDKIIRLKPIPVNEIQDRIIKDRREEIADEPIQIVVDANHYACQYCPRQGSFTSPSLLYQHKMEYHPKELKREQMIHNLQSRISRKDGNGQHIMTSYLEDDVAYHKAVESLPGNNGVEPMDMTPQQNTPTEEAKVDTVDLTSGESEAEDEQNSNQSETEAPETVPNDDKLVDSDEDDSNPSGTEQTPSLGNGNAEIISSNEKSFKCERCAFATGRKENLRRHMMRIHDVSLTIKNERCDQCDFVTFNKVLLLRHRVLSHGISSDNVQKCNMCDFVTVSASHGRANIQRHMRQKHGDQEKKQEEPEAEHADKLVDSDEDDSNLDGTQEADSDKNDMTEDNVMPNENDFRCNDCSFATARKDNLILHMMRIHGSSIYGKNERCDQCEYVTFSKATLDRHRISHHGISSDNNQKCNECDFVSVSPTHGRANLLRHIRQKHGDQVLKQEPEAEDEQADKLVDSDEADSNLYDTPQEADSDNNEMVTENKTMPNENNFKCNDCSFATAHKDNLRRHMVRVHGSSISGKNEKCDQCEYVTFNKATLDRHRLSHHGISSDNSQKCNECDFVSVSPTHGRANLLRHIRSKHGEQMIKCDECDYETPRNDILLKHKRRQHGGQTENQQDNDTPAQMDFSESGNVNAVLGSIPPHFMSQQDTEI